MSTPRGPGRERRAVTVSFSFELRAKPIVGAPGVLAGHAAVFDVISDLRGQGQFLEKVARGAFKDSIRKDDIRALFNHSPNHVLARKGAGTLTLAEDSKGLAVEIDLPSTQLGRDLAEWIRRGDINEMSFGFDCLDDDWSHDSEGNRVRTLRKVKLYDASPVTFPAYPQTDLAFRWATAGARRMINLELMRRQLELLAVG